MKWHKTIIAILIIISMLCSVTAFAGEGIELTAKSAILIEQSTGKVIFDSNADEKLPIASVTKVMTMLLIMEALDNGNIALNEMVTVSEHAASMGGSQVFLEPGEQMTVSDMLKAIAVASGNDACVAMAEHIGGTEPSFVDKMNKKAKELGMQNTHFVNCNGLDIDDHYSSARDVAIISKELLKHNQIFEYLTIWMDSLRDGEFGLANTNKLIKYYSGANGVKTGSTGKAMFCVSASAKRDGMQLIAVVLGAPTSKERFADASKLLDYGFAKYGIKNVVTKGSAELTADIEKGVEKTVLLETADDFSYLCEKGNSPEIITETVLSKKIEAPVKKGDVLGKIKIKIGDNEIGEVDLVAKNDILKVNVFDVFKKLFLKVR